MQKPELLYHASPEKDVTEFEPRNETPRFKGEENLVFATPYKEVAAMFLTPKNIPTEISKYGNTYAVFINGTKEEFIVLDKGGAIYTLPNSTFETNNEIGMGVTEWVSRQPIKPSSKTVYDSSIKALSENGVNVYFLDNDTFLKVQADPSNGLEIVKNLELAYEE